MKTLRPKAGEISKRSGAVDRSITHGGLLVGESKLFYKHIFHLAEVKSVIRTAPFSHRPYFILQNSRQSSYRRKQNRNQVSFRKSTSTAGKQP